VVLVAVLLAVHHFSTKLVEKKDRAVVQVFGLKVALMVAVGQDAEQLSATRKAVGAASELFGQAARALLVNSQQQTRVIYDGTLYSH
jgi:light-regulated signal transduction histidine kinase (bacteriophytochrome)